MIEVLSFVGLLGLFMLIAFRDGGGKRLNLKFAALGEVKGMSKTAIIAAVGAPVCIEARAQGVTALEWRQGRYRAVLGFVDETCIGVLHQSMI